MGVGVGVGVGVAASMSMSIYLMPPCEKSIHSAESALLDCSHLNGYGLIL
jgi:hypothetical protein